MQGFPGKNLPVKAANFKISRAYAILNFNAGKVTTLEIMSNI